MLAVQQVAKRMQEVRTELYGQENGREDTMERIEGGERIHVPGPPSPPNRARVGIGLGVGMGRPEKLPTWRVWVAQRSRVADLSAPFRAWAAKEAA